MNCNLRRKSLRCVAVLCLLVLAGCQRAPAFSILGSYFPAWLFCLLVGVLLTAAARLLLRRKDLGQVLDPPLLMYPCLTAFFTFALWLIFFRT